MNYKYGKTSKSKLKTVDSRLRDIFEKVLSLGMIDISILEGERGKTEQDGYFECGKSKCKWPDGKHNVQHYNEFSQAVDAAPYVASKASYNHKHCCFLAGLVLATAAELEIKIRWGGNWDMDGEPVTDQDFQDLLHYELID